MKRFRSDGVRQVFVMTRPMHERRMKAKLLSAQQDLAHTWRRLTAKERAREYPPETVEALLRRAAVESAAICPEDLY